ncbi:NosD domain-containing protein [Natronolimnohabitans sp. A-GB9]|uniref:NosD domain-containing protein n=1 Tax=Natronolimnohabitans sp. A-GB9 TaxID=3069757 RepID=UPI0027B22BE7|nr:NosD domain-containing protein [Natronolimnohabitans sp. A-GB9]MDQ2050074.1 NosD domain-containing protein [Natronolimnohabitans sp. A-GB9]
MRKSVRLGCVFLVAFVLLGGAGLFVADPGTSSPDPVLFEDTVTMGVTLENDPGGGEIDVPKAQAFYSQYEYVVGYRGVERLVDHHHQPDHRSQFGYPLAVYVTDFGSAEVELTEDGYPTVDGSLEWTDAESATFVVDSDARTPAGETVVPFADRDDAERFASAHGGDVRSWEQLLDRQFDVDDATAVRDRVDERHERADEQVAAASDLTERPAALVVGEDTETIQAAIEEAPANTTVVVPDGTYEETITVDRPVTVAGEGNATIRGDENSTVVTVESDRAAVTGVHVTGVGETTTTEGDPTDDGDALEMAYGQGDAGIEVDGGADVVIEDVTIDTAASGVLLRDSPEFVVRNVTVEESERVAEGYMGVMTIGSPDGLVENSQFSDGRDGLYTHRSDGLVYRDNVLERNRIGVHLMYTSNVLIADNRITDARATGIDVMTSPEHNAVVGNEIRGSDRGLLMAGTRSYVADNLITDTSLGLTVGAGASIYEGNVLVGNDDGMRATHPLPTNSVVDNDFVDNERHATAGSGVLRTWSEDGTGNYWEGAIGSSEGAVLDRPYSPTESVDRNLHRVDGTPTLAQAPTTHAIETVDDAVPGMRAASIVDTAPLCEPANPDLLERTDAELPDRDCVAN